MRKIKFLIVLLLLSGATGYAQLALLKTMEKGSNKMIAKSINIKEQQRLIDSLISITLEEDDSDNDDVFVDYLYANDWDNSELNPYKVKIAALPDSFTTRLADFFPPTENVVTSEYGRRWGRFHAGIDLRVKVGDTIRSAFDGKIRITRTEKYGYGYFVVIRHDNSLETLYGHLSKILVTPDQFVKAGDAIALGGNTGRSTGPHLHFEVRFMGNAFNPRKIIDFENFVVFNDIYTIKKKETFDELTEFLENPRASHKKNRYYASASSSSSSSSSASGGNHSYSIKSGDTLYKIARNNGTTVARLCQLNKINANTTLRIGQKIRY